MADFVPIEGEITLEAVYECVGQVHRCLEEGKKANVDANIVLSAQIKGAVGQLVELKSAEAATQKLLEKHRISVAKELKLHKKSSAKDIAAIDSKVEMVDASVIDLQHQLASAQEVNERTTKAVDTKVENLTTAFGLTSDEKKRKKPIALMGQWEVVIKAGGAVGSFFFLWKFIDFMLPFAKTEILGFVHFLIALNEFVKK